jgi:type II secretory pathway pseudopilin PulG
MENDAETESRSRKNFWRGKPNKWLWVILIVVLAVAFAFAIVRYNMSVATQLQQTERENSQLRASQNQMQQENNQLQINQNQLQANQQFQQCETACTGHTPLFSQNYWEYCSQTLGCRRFSTQQDCINSCVKNP